MAVDTVIKSCKIVNHDGVRDAGLAVNEGKIVAIAMDQDLPSAETIIDCEGNYVIPGVVDAHVHLECPPDWIPPVDRGTNLKNETQQYAVNGCTTVVEMLAPAADMVEEAKEFVEIYEKNALIDLGLSSRIYSLEDIKHIQNMADYGVAGFKLLLPYKGLAGLWEGGETREKDIDDGIAYLTFKEVARLIKRGYDIHAKVHCENVEIFNRIKESFIEEGREPASWHDVRPSICEEEAIRMCLYLASITGCTLYIVHMSIKEGVELVAKSKSEGVRVIAETLCAHLILNVDNTDRLLSKTMPPIRTQEDSEMLWQGIRSGTVSIVATDSCPAVKEKKADLWNSPPPIGGSEMLLPVMLSEGVNRGRIPMEKLVEVCCYNPAKISGLTPRKGMIAVGSDADLVVVDLEKKAVVPERPVYSTTDYSLLAGLKLTGWPILTVVRGEVVAEAGKAVGEPGHGKYVVANTRPNS